MQEALQIYIFHVNQKPVLLLRAVVGSPDAETISSKPLLFFLTVSGLGLHLRMVESRRQFITAVLS